jgi:hypothetical protein
MIIGHISSRELAIKNMHYLHNIFGFVDADMGLKIVVDAVNNIDGSIEHSLEGIIKNKIYINKDEDALNDFIEWIYKTCIIIRGL